ncbi:hypothetical protein QE410_000995 [Microbacterium sp. SORGH_AS 1204]|uniref:hypothetical protein n=1 Tax=Microbacterium sp. SORGH_AS_1204 TaxID=3041785 RepID=UPI002793D047|nr:hypothetical protein [Microbacterium sp. SORGH_AS_1204]MDQ1136196.1 hypothetical protein [Microbacterium sp. SORGH_AS_1204]
MSFLLLAPVAVVAACAPESERESPTSPASPTATPTESTGTGLGAVGPAAASAAPEIPDSGDVFGPTGQRWPSRTPRAYDAFDASVECDCTWEAIAAAITAVDRAAPDGSARVLVRPGTLSGDGAGSTAKPVLSQIGREGRSSRILVIPRDGTESVSIDDSIRLDAIVGISFAGFWTFPGSVVLTSTRDVAWAWSKGQAFNITSGDSGPTESTEFVECVTPDAVAADADTWAFRTGSNAMREVSVRGCYLAPTYKAEGSEAHCDTLQLSGDEDMDGLLVEGTVLFSSTNAGFIPTAEANNIVFDRSLLVGGDRMLERYPLPDGANAFTSGQPAAVNAAKSIDRMSAKDSVFIGRVRGTFSRAENTTVSAAETPRASSGAFQSDPSLDGIDADWLDERAPLPTDDRLRTIWRLR